MPKQIQDAYIVAATRTPIGRSHRGFFRHMRPDDLLVQALRAALAQAPTLDPAAIEDIICGCAIPEGPQGLNIARIGAVLADLVINGHPLSNDATTSIGRDDLLRFLEATGHTPLVLKVTA